MTNKLILWAIIIALFVAIAQLYENGQYFLTAMAFIGTLSLIAANIYGDLTE